MASEPLLLHSLSEHDEDVRRTDDIEHQHQPAPGKGHERHASIFEHLIRPAWGRQRKALCNVKLSMSCLAVLLALLGVWLLSWTRRSTAAGRPGVRYFFVFGDSYSRIGFSPSGALPSAAHPFGNMQDPPTTTGGLNWAQMLATQYNSSVTYMYDLAAGGATVDKDIVPPPHDASVRDFNGQVRLFNKTVHRKGAPALEARKDGVFAVWFGQNDVDQVHNRTFSNPNGTFDSTFDVYFDRVGDLWRIGAREFIFIGVSPISQSPMVRAEQNETEVASLSRAFNDRLEARIQEFVQRHPGVKWHYYDPASAFNRVWDNPRLYGLSNGTCMDWRGVRCVWRDHFHPGVRVHEQVAADIAALGCRLFLPRVTLDSAMNIES